MTDRQLIVVLPGIGDSVLARRGRPQDVVWDAGKGDRRRGQRLAGRSRATGGAAGLRAVAGAVPGAGDGRVAAAAAARRVRS